MVISNILIELVVFSGQLVVRRGRGAPKNLSRAEAPKAPELVTSVPAAARAPPALKKSTTAPARRALICRSFPKISFHDYVSKIEIMTKCLLGGFRLRSDLNTGLNV